MKQRGNNKEDEEGEGKGGVRGVQENRGKMETREKGEEMMNGVKKGMLEEGLIREWQGVRRDGVGCLQEEEKVFKGREKKEMSAVTSVQEV